MKKHPNLFNEVDTKNNIDRDNEVKQSDFIDDVKSDSTVSLIGDDIENDQNYDELKNFANPNKVKPNIFSNELSGDDDNDDETVDDEIDDDDDDETGSQRSKSTAVASELSDEGQKLDYITKLRILKDNGHVVKDFNLSDRTLDIKLEYHRVTRALEISASIKFQQKMLMAAVSAIEFLNKRFDPFDIQLEGWSENILENIDDFSTIFEKLHDKYCSKHEMAPELELMLALAGSAFMFNLTNTLFKKSLPTDPMDFANLKNTVRNAAASANSNISNQQGQNKKNNAMGGLPDLSALMGQFGNMMMPSVLGRNNNDDESSVTTDDEYEKPLPANANIGKNKPTMNSLNPMTNQQQHFSKTMLNDNDSDTNERFSVSSSVSNDHYNDNLIIQKEHPLKRSKTSRRSNNVVKTVKNKRELII
ncbi:hypothetical protein [Heterosigma akashiwo virus 01]|uniref:Uncharacterized protein n=1 Tax=Heterosigma akashiwo virus 01 TaxID=97195 RepID=A0A1C9C571_HAV01|nr:hypothetical protein D1R72_gp103 [Heterosigma akashiwo virus 01]AOM63434.1 hypothetical protein [Heterosigma akashiwo virus 01]